MDELLKELLTKKCKRCKREFIPLKDHQLNCGDCAWLLYLRSLEELPL
jgi:hypothetical protein